MEILKIGTIEWWKNEDKGEIYLEIAKACCVHNITPKKAVELLRYAEHPVGELPPCYWFDVSLCSAGEAHSEES